MSAASSGEAGGNLQRQTPGQEIDACGARLVAGGIDALSLDALELREGLPEERHAVLVVLPVLHQEHVLRTG